MSSLAEFSSFVLFSLFGVIWETYLALKDEINVKTWSQIISELGDLPIEITNIYITQSSYWLAFYP